jgi:hypothetical protein
MIKTKGYKTKVTLDGVIKEEVEGIFAPQIIKMYGNKLSKMVGDAKLVYKVVDEDTGEVYEGGVDNIKIQDIPNDLNLNGITFAEYKHYTGQLAEWLRIEKSKPVEELDESENAEETI